MPTSPINCARNARTANKGKLGEKVRGNVNGRMKVASPSEQSSDPDQDKTNSFLVVGVGAAELLERAQKQGCDFPLLPKPVHPEDLLKKVAEILNSSEFHQVAQPAVNSKIRWSKTGYVAGLSLFSYRS